MTRKGVRRAKPRRSRRGAGTGSSRRKLRFAVIGQGHFAQAAVLPAFKAVKGVELTALFSEDPTKQRALKRKYRVEHALPYSEFDEFLASGAVDAVYIALPNDLHCEYTERAARAGVHVLCEKPAAVFASEVEDMIDACETNRVKLMIAYRLHFEPANLHAVEAISRGKIGDPRFFSSTFSLQVRKENIRTDRERGGGPLHDLGVYCVNATRYLFRDEPTEVVAFAGSQPGDARFEEIDEHLGVLLRFPDGRLAQFICSFGAQDASAYTVVGTKGRLRLDPAYDYAVPLQLEIQTEDGRTSRRRFKKGDQVAAEIAEFAACIREDRDPVADGYEGLADLQVVDAIVKSVETGRPVKVRPVERTRRPSLSQARHVAPHDEPELVRVAPGHADS